MGDKVHNKSYKNGSTGDSKYGFVTKSLELMIYVIKKRVGNIWNTYTNYRWDILKNERKYQWKSAIICLTCKHQKRLNPVNAAAEKEIDCLLRNNTKTKKILNSL